ncbi:hypothetical protein GKZ89_08700 [Bacillus mangrovi]|uniref:ABC transmembrane type-1 domain-containing protein n=1 Tax=Metabacillus mangrovi TaxID=1491830 RepID=A0A7X2S4R7_9BACI|nr:ABC transporter permease subunit [Metabacillus mangrovi]MTH53495.1 hypothetical protein [Metabacillus mangrovi]
MKKILLLAVQVIYAFLLILLISGLPILFQNMKPDFAGYFEYIQQVVLKLIYFNNDTFWGMSPIFPTVVERTADSLILLILAILIGFVLSFFASSAAVLFMKDKGVWLKRLIFGAEAIPDIFIITVLQAVVIMIYKKTDVLIVRVASLGDDKSYFLPLVCLVIPASVFLMKIMIHAFEEEYGKRYVELARSIGTAPLRLLWLHIVRNTVHRFMIASKTLIWSLLASLLIIEYVFNYPGVLSFLLTYRSPEVFLVSVSLLFLPFFLLYQSYFMFAPSLIKGEKDG